MNDWGMAKNEKWEYARYLFDWQKNILQLGENKKLTWDEMWKFFNLLGSEGWEMINTIPLSEAMGGHVGGDTNRILFIFKRLKQD